MVWRGLSCAVVTLGAICSGVFLVLSISVVSLTIATASAAGLQVTWVEEATPWGLAQVGPHERSLELTYEDGGCAARRVRASVQEIRSSVSISLFKEVPTVPTGGEAPSGPRLVCPAIARIKALLVSLPAPLAGRRISGHWRGGGFASEVAPYAVPRLIGLAPGDAERLLKDYGARAHLRVSHVAHGLARVGEQYPPPGRVMPRDGVVRLRIDER